MKTKISMILVAAVAAIGVASAGLLNVYDATSDEITVDEDVTFHPAKDIGLDNEYKLGLESGEGSISLNPNQTITFVYRAEKDISIESNSTENVEGDNISSTSLNLENDEELILSVKADADSNASIDLGDSEVTADVE